MRIRRFGFLIWVSLAFFSVWGCDDSASGGSAQPCQISADCPVGEFCQPSSDGRRLCAPNVIPDTTGGDSQVDSSPQLGGNVPPNGSQPTGDEDSALPTIGSFGGQMTMNNQSPNSGGSPGVNDEPTGNSNTNTNPDGPAASNGGDCPEIRRALKPSAGSIPRVMLVVDRSWSMLDTEDRWTPIERALTQVTQALEQQVKFGLVIFPDPAPMGPPDPVAFNACLAKPRSQLECEEAYDACAPGTVVVEPALNTSQQIITQLQLKRPSPNQGTPTASALDAAHQKLLENPSAHDFVILATDGGPGCNFSLNAQQCMCMNANCSVFGNPEMCLDDVATLNAVTRLATDGIRTLVLGISIGLPAEGGCLAGRCLNDGQACVNGQCINQAPKVLDAMAVAGQTDVNGRHYAVDDLAEIQQRLTAVAGSLAPCTYGLEQLAEFVDQLLVVIDEMEIMRDPTHTNGWDVVDGLLELYGPACERLRDGAPHVLSATCR